VNEVPSTGMTWPDFKERFARLREAVTLTRRLWTEERVTFEGQYYRTQGATIYDHPATPVSVYIAAASALIAKYAGTRSQTRTLLFEVERELIGDLGAIRPA